MPNDSTVLIVEDNAELRLDLSDLFELEDYTVYTAQCGTEALDLIRQVTIDAVVSDYEMPIMNGIALLQALRTDQTTSQMPFILVSGGNPPAVEDDPLFCFLRKPFTIEEMLRTTAQLIARRRRLAYHAAD